MTTAQEVESCIDSLQGDVVNGYLEQYAALIQKYADAVAENARLKAALDRYSEDEMLLIERCAVRGRLAQLEGKLVDVEIRALKVEPVQVIGGNDPEYLAEVFWRTAERRMGERRVAKDNKWRDECWSVLRSGNDRRQK